MAVNDCMPLVPSVGFFLLVGSSIEKLSTEKVVAATVGIKACGLASIPQEWTLPFFVISGLQEIAEESVFEALSLLDVKMHSKLIVRSSGVNETLDSRGSLDSAECFPGEVVETLAKLRVAILSSQPQCDLKTIHWVVQVAATTQRKGHLSNERRLSKALRDWTAETEASKKSPSENFRIPIRKWRDARSADIKKLECRYTANISISLAAVASWTHNRKVRVHYEWVWDGEFVYIVQADECDEVKNGVDPTKLVKAQSPKKISAKTSKFRAAIEQDFQSYRKLANAKLYRGLGYSPVDFYVLDISSELDSILQHGICSPELISDLEVLTARPLVIRTDGANIPKAKHDMLPRSDELRSASAAAAWLIGDFRKKIIELDLVHSGLCLISHHFIPASASAWCQAQPNKRRVRIESLWGIPEGIYWYAHDVFDVDTKHASAMKPIEKPHNFVVRERLRYKKRFVAPNEAGDWVVHEAASGFDWKRSIKHQDWIEEIAWTSRKIAETLNKAVVVMWFIDIPSKVSSHKVIPWFHTGWQLEGPTPTKAVPRKKIASSEEITIRTMNDWVHLKQRAAQHGSIARVLIDPIEQELVRNPKFATELAELAQKVGFVVELAGGILSHAYYMLSSSGCRVECADLYATDEGAIDFNKLVRDKIPEAIHAKGEEVKYVKLEGEALIKALKRKIIEEAFEVSDAETRHDIVEELADLRETVNALTKNLGITNKEIEDARIEKKASRGAFDNALMLEKTALASSLGLLHVDNQDPFLLALPQFEKIISTVDQLPSYDHDINSDKRHDAQGTFERQFTLNMPAYAENFHPPRKSFTLETSTGEKIEYILELTMERRSADIRCKFRIINAPAQLKLEL